MTEPDFSKMTTREILEWQYKNKPQVGEECELVGIEKQELARFKTMEKKYLEQFAKSLKLADDCITLAQKLLQVKPDLKEWLEKHYGEYL